jgi:peptidoglycan lytic transglycosylase
VGAGRHGRPTLARTAATGSAARLAGLTAGAVLAAVVPAGAVGIGGAADPTPPAPDPVARPTEAPLTPPTHPEPRAPRAGAITRTWTASWYGPGFAGRPTANGERFDPSALTAAHRTLPFGTRLLVTNQATGRSVRVRVNDRGPYVAGRDLDLSAAAARSIGLAGVGQVTVEVAGPTSARTPAGRPTGHLAPAAHVLVR